MLIEVADGLGLARTAFTDELDRQSGAAVQAHFEDTRALMAQVGAHGFPSFWLQVDGLMKSVDFSHYLGRPEAFRDWPREQMPLASLPAAHKHSCDADGCVI